MASLRGYFVRALLLLNSVTVYTICRFTHATAQLSHLDRSTYEEGRKQFELIQHQSELPQYGQCWKDAMVFIQNGCKRLSDDMQGRLALAYLNCFLSLQGRDVYECSQGTPVVDCTREMSDVDRGSFTTFFTHTQNICYFLQAQIWNEAAEHTIARLAESSSHVAEQLQQSHELQHEMIKQQNDSLQNQKVLMNNAANLTSVLANSSEEINRLFFTFKETTKEQRMLITDVFDQLISLKQTVVGEFSGFYSILYYFFSVLLCYLLTSTARTGGARFWLFSIVTASIACEYLITAWLPAVLVAWSVDLSVHDDWLYWVRGLCRKLFACVGLVVLGLFAYNYHDINAANNLLLVEIRKQNSDLKRLLFGIQPRPVKTEQPDALAVKSASEDMTDSCSELETESYSTDSDQTYILQDENTSVAESDSYMTAHTLGGSSADEVGADSLLAELRDLRSATPLKEMSGQLERWISTGQYSSSGQSGSSRSSRASTPAKDTSPGRYQYFLRPRKARLTYTPPAAQVETSRSFAKTVKQLERLAEKNSRIVRAAVSARNSKPAL
ncbi:hypothetical protein BaRGS_00020158 [Batillaria attramentaria]|uniref:Uncharacterized protein n=1 Tax=Batillaria attramentaria TaxID=370345 RepID=A0ABD0KNN7_9CAEN